MPNSYRYFESGEVSLDRFIIEVELLKELKKFDLLNGIDWSFYDTQALKIFLQAGIDEVNYELNRRYRKGSKECNVINLCVQKHRTEKNFKKQNVSFIIIFNTMFVIISVLFLIGFFIYEYRKFDNHLFKTFDHPLTAKRRHLSFVDEFSIILLALTSGMILSYIIKTTKFSRKLILLGMVAFIIIILLVMRKTYQIVSFLSTYRELRWSMLYDYMYS